MKRKSKGEKIKRKVKKFKAEKTEKDIKLNEHTELKNYSPLSLPTIDNSNPKVEQFWMKDINAARELWEAIRLNDVESVKRSLEEIKKQGYDINNIYDETRNNALHFAIASSNIGKLDIIKYLIEYDQNLITTNPYIIPTWKLAIDKGDIELFKYLVVIREKVIPFNIAFYTVALYEAIKAGHLDFVRYMVGELSIDVKSLHKFSLSLTHFFDKEKNYELFEYLLKRGLSVDSIISNDQINGKGIKGFTEYIEYLHKKIHLLEKKYDDLEYILFMKKHSSVDSDMIIDIFGEFEVGNDSE